MRPILTLLLGAAFFSTFGVLIRALDPYFGPLTQTALRFLAAGIVLLLATRTRHSGRKMRGIWSPAGVAFMVVFPAMVVTFTYAALQLKAANALFLLYATNIVCSLVLGRLVFGERMVFRQLMASGLALAGVAFLTNFANPFAWSIGTIAGLLSGVFECLANLLRRKLKHVDSHMLLLVQFFVGAFCLLPIALRWDPQPIHHWDAAALLPLGVFGIVLAFGNLCFNYGFQRLPLALATVLVSSELGIALFLNSWWLAEIPTGREIAGVVAIGVAVVMSVQKR